MTGAPIYLVSACASGEEFVAAFRRYADKHGLFVPLAEPLPAGGRGRFAVTLRDGGVMIEGEAEIISSARTPSVLHGRVGMTLRFLEPDDASRTTLGELEKARLAMKPAPPSIPPRPAALPAGPRPVPPPVQGRIDAVNALAECVAIGDTNSLGSPVVAVPPKAGPRFVVPAIPGAGARTRPQTGSAGGGLEVGSRVSTAPRTPTAPMPIVMATPDQRNERNDATPPSVTPRATPQPDRLRKSAERRADSAQLAVVPSISGFSQTMTAVPPAMGHGPTSATMIVAGPPEPPPSGAADPSSPRDAVEIPAVAPRTTTRPGMPAPLPPAAQAPALPGPARDTAISTTMTAVPRPATTSSSAPTEIGGVLVDPLAPVDAAPGMVLATPAHDDVSARTQVHAGAPTREPVALPGAAAPASAPPSLDRPAPPVVAAEPPAAPEVEIAEPTDLSLGPPEPSGTTSRSAELVIAEPEVLELPAPPPRKTAIGVAVPPSVPQLAATIAPADLAADEPPVEAAASAAPAQPAAVMAAMAAPTIDATPGMVPEVTIEEPTPSDDWSVRPDGALTAGQPGDPPATPPAAVGPGPAGLPSGDWTIALDPRAPDGWTAPFDSTGGLAPPPLAPPPRRAGRYTDELPAVEPKVQIDPTLIEPLAALPADDLPHTVGGAAPRRAVYASPTSATLVDAPMNMMMAASQANPFAVQHGQVPMQAPTYPLDPGYQMVPIASLPSPYASEPALPVRSGRRRAIIIIASALVAVAIGVAALAHGKDADGHDAPAIAPPDLPSVAPTPPAPAGPTAQASTRPAAEVPARPLAQAPAATAGEAVAAAVANDAATAGSGAPPGPATGCFAEVSSLPPGADIVIDQTNVIGTTPQKVALPCGEKVEVTIRKARLVPATRMITPTPEGAKIKVALARQTFLVKVSSTPAGATITLNGKPLGVTPTTIKIPAFEPAMLNIAKDGYTTEIEKVTPKSNGIAVHTALKKQDRKLLR